MFQIGSDLLPAARIHCNSGRIQVGNHSYLSATTALSAYIQQFDGKQQNSSDFSSSFSKSYQYAFSAKATQNSVPSSTPAEVTDVLTEYPTSSMVGVSSDISTHFLNRESPVQWSSRHSGSDIFVNPNLLQYNSNSVASIHPHSYTSSSNPKQHIILNTPGLVHKISQNTSNHHNFIGNIDVNSRSLSEVNKSDSKEFLTLDGYIQNRQDRCVNLWNGPEMLNKEQRAKSEVEILLTAMPSQRELEIITQEALREVKLKRLLKEASNSQSSTNKSCLQQEVEEALSRSAQLLETVRTGILVKSPSVSEVNSLNTDILLSLNPCQAFRTRKTTHHENRSRHRYSYHTLNHHIRSHSVGQTATQDRQPSFRDKGRRHSVESISHHSSSLGSKGSHFEGFMCSSSVQADPEVILKQSQACKVPPKRSSDQTHSPSWIQELMASTPVNNMPYLTNSTECASATFFKTGITNGHQVPSWINDLEAKASSIMTQDLQGAAATVALGGVKKSSLSDATENSTFTDLSHVGLGLNYSDLGTNPTVNKYKGLLSSECQHYQKPPVKMTRNNSFSGLGTGSANQKKDSRSKPLDLNQFHQDLADIDLKRPKSHHLCPNYNSLGGIGSSAFVVRNQEVNKSAHAKSSRDNYLSQQNCNAKFKIDGKVTSEAVHVISDLPQSSCVDSLEGFGQYSGELAETTGTNAVRKGSSHTLHAMQSPTEQNKALDITEVISDAEEDLLNGDRSWECLLPSIKTPVPVRNTSPGRIETRSETPTLSGGHQPGSMEALKQMYFRLQKEENSALFSFPDHPLHQDGEAAMLIPALKDYNFEDEPGGQSLERALVHLGRLKTLVQTGTNTSQSQLQEYAPIVKTDLT